MSIARKLTHTSIVAACVAAGAAAPTADAGANPDTASVTGIISSYLASYKLRDDFQMVLNKTGMEGAWKSSDVLLQSFYKFIVGLDLPPPPGLGGGD